MRTPIVALHRGTGIQPVAWSRAPQGAALLNEVCFSSSRPNPRTFTSVDEDVSAQNVSAQDVSAQNVSAKNPIHAINMLEVTAASG